MKKLLSISILLWLGISFISAQSQVKIDVSEDSYIWSNTSDEGDETSVVRGADETLVSYFNESRLYRRMVFLKFDLATAPAKANITSVKLRMYGIADAGGGINTTTNEATPSTHKLGVYNMNGQEKSGSTLWTESTFNYSTWVTNYDHARNPPYLAGELDGVTGEGWLEWDITAELKDYVIGIDQILTLYVCDEHIMKIPTDPADNTNSYVTFHSKENSSGNKAYLVFNPDGSGIGSNQTQSGINYRITDKSLTISEIAPQSKVKITDLSGKTVYSVIANNTLDYTFVNGGIYILSVQNDVNASSIKLLVK